METKKSKKTFIIVGGNFQNTGAQSMTYVTVDALRKRYPACNIVMFTSANDSNEDNNYSFCVKYISNTTFEHAKAGGKAGSKYYLKGLAKLVLRKGNCFKEYKTLMALLQNCDAVFDISGFAISSQFKSWSTLKKMDDLDLYSQYRIPYYFMPQSFGPFEYAEKEKPFVVRRLQESLPKAKKIFAREWEGYQMLKALIGEEHIEKSNDMVLQSQSIDKKNLYTDVPVIHEIKLTTHNNVAIVPNMRTFEHGDKEEILSVYEDIIHVLLDRNKSIYLLSHSSEDITACHMIKRRFTEESRVVVIQQKLDAWNFEGLIHQFDFAIASRFHSIVHAYKACVPCIVLGWATKYHELLEEMGQSEYIFDVRNLSQKDDLLKAVRVMDESYSYEKERISSVLTQFQKESCFDSIDL